MGPLSDEDIEELCSNILPVILEDTDLLGFLKAELKGTHWLPGAIDAVNVIRDVSNNDLTRLCHVLRLYDLSGNSVSLLSDMASRGIFPKDVTGCDGWEYLVKNLVTVEGVDPKLEPEWNHLQTRLFAQEPNSFLSALISSGQIPMQGDHVKAVTDVLRVMSTSFGVNIAKDPIRQLLQHPATHDKSGITIFEAANVPESERKDVKDFLERLQRLQALVTFPRDIGLLMICSFTSAEEIANRDDSVAVMEKHGIPLGRAHRIRNHAMVITVRNESIWTESLRQSSKAIVSGEHQNNSSWSKDRPDTSSTEVNLSTMFGMESTGCDECSSATGPAAYFVDLLQNLKKIQLQDQSKSTLLDKLLSRRPDLGELELSCANTKVVIPYIDLVNEVLESVVSAVSRGRNEDGWIKQYNMTDSDTSESHITEPQNVDATVYRDIIQPIVYPLQLFPYNEAIDCIRVYLSALGVSRLQLLRAFRSIHQITNIPRLFPYAVWVSDRAIAAETLGLQHEDYVAIGKEGFYPAEFFDEDEAANRQRIQLKESYEYWGYASENEMCNENGLTRIKENFLPRSGINFETFLRILATRYIGKRLVIEAVPPKGAGNVDDFKDGGLRFTGRIQDMRLRRLNKDGKAGPLDKTICDLLQAFLRLQRNLGWSIEDLDILTVTLAKTRTVSFDPELLCELAAVKQLADITSFSLMRLQPLWGDMNTIGQNALYNQLFHRAMLEHDIFDLNGDRGFLEGDHKLIDYLDTVLRALSLSASDFKWIKLCANIKEDQLLSLNTISSLYRISLLCKIIGIPAQGYNDMLSLYPPNFDPFASPRTTLDLVKELKPGKSSSRRLTLDQLLFIVKGKPGVSLSKTFAATKSICTTLVATGALDRANSDLDHVKQQQAILLSLRSQLPRMDANALDFALSEIIQAKVSVKSPNVSGFDALLGLSREDCQSSGFEGWFTPPSSEKYTISCPGATTEDNLYIDGVPLTLEACQWSTGPLVAGHHYELTLSGRKKIRDLKWRPEQAAEKTAMSFTSDVLISQQQLSTTEYVLSALTRIDLLMVDLGISLPELEFWHKSNSFNFSHLTRKDVQKLEQYCLLKQEFMSNGATEHLLAFYKWLMPFKACTKDQLATKMAPSTGWSVKICLEFLEAKYPSMDDSFLAQELRDIATLYDMREAIRFFDKLDLRGISPSHLFAMAKPALPPTATEDFQNAAVLRSAIHVRFASSSSSSPTVISSANDHLRSNRRTALIHHLLSTEYATENHLSEPDSLFGHFLIDVQMGPVLHTSRINQAISTIQLFVQRCLLGAEKNNGITKDKVRQASQDLNIDWDSMFRYRLWEANRKVFLYPENWADPTLRDDKTEQFIQAESAITQAKLDSESIASIIKGYLHAVDDVADLQVESYLWEQKEGSRRTQSDIHFFGRTRHAPLIYYYRKLELRDIEQDRTYFWTPWEKIDVDVPVLRREPDLETSATLGAYLVPVVWKGRLLVFLPEVILGQKPKEKTHDFNFGALTTGGEGKTVSSLHPERWWELRVGFSEKRDGKWSHKRVAQSAIHISQDDNRNLPDISKLRFWTRTKSSAPKTPILVLEVEYCQDPEKPRILGEFELRGQQLILAESKRGFSVEDSESTSISTEFSKYTMRDVGNPPSPREILIRRPDNKKTKTRLPVVVGDGKSQFTHKWAMSFDEINQDTPTGLVFDVSNADHVQSWVAWPSGERRFETEEFSNHISPYLIENMYSGAGVTTAFEALEKLPINLRNHAFGARNSNMYNERSTPFAIYNWELGVHLPSLLMERLMATQQFELALTVAKLMFDPTAVFSSAEDAESYQTINKRCWSFPPFKSGGLKYESLQDMSWIDTVRRAEWQESKRNVHASARGKRFAYMKRIAIKYIEILIALGDQSYRQYTMETLPVAIQRYTEALHVFGPPPVEIPNIGKRSVKSYNQIMKELRKDGDAIGEAKVNIELDFPFYSEPENRGNGSMDGLGPLGFIATEYFCVPANPEFVVLRQKIDDRLFKIRNGMDINGNHVRLPVFEPPIDPGAVAKANAGPAGASMAGLLTGLKTPMPKYRFNYLILRALELVNELRSSAQQLLMIKEKKDAEELSILRSKHQDRVLEIMLCMKQNQKAEVQRSIDVLIETRKQQKVRLQYFLALSGDKTKIPDEGGKWEDIVQEIESPPKNDELRRSPEEKTEMELADLATHLNEGAGGIQAAAELTFALPNISVAMEPMGVGTSISTGGPLLGQVMLASVDGLRILSELASSESTKASRKNNLKRQLQERQLEANVAGRELMKIDKDVSQLKTRMQTCDLEIQAQQTEIENAAAEREWLNTKYTNGQLYAVLDNSLSGLLYQTYLLASEMAHIAQRALEFEHAVPASFNSSRFKGLGNYWENSHDGLLSGESLFLDLKRMEMMHMESKTHDYEITKTISLRQVNPRALLELRENGGTDFKIPEVLFDLDFPGHYCRRIASVAVSIPCILGAYTTLSCTLSLTKHGCRVDTASASDAKAYKKSRNDDSPNFPIDSIPITSIAVSSGIQDTGGFDLNFTGTERYGPFEGAGAVSSWRIDLPKELRQFDYNTITDVVLHLRYTAFYDGALAKVASEASLEAMKKSKSNQMAIDLKNDYPAEWHRFISGDDLALRDLQNRLPFWTRGRTILANKVSLFLSPKPSPNLETVEINYVESGSMSLKSEKASPLGSYHVLEYAEDNDKSGPTVTDKWVISRVQRKNLERGWLILEYCLN